MAFILLQVIKQYQRHRRQQLRILARAVLCSLYHSFNREKNQTTNNGDDGVQWWIDFGTLLGWRRERDIILGDTDVDICVLIPSSGNVEAILAPVAHCLRQRKDGDFHLSRQYATIYRVQNHCRQIWCPFVDIYINRLPTSPNTDEAVMIRGATGGNSDIPMALIGTPQYVTKAYFEGPFPQLVISHG